MPTRFDMTIAGVDVECRLGTLNINETINGRNTLTCEVLSVDAAYRPAKGAELLVDDAETPGDPAFGGNIATPSEHVIDDQLIEEFATTIEASDFNAIADRITVVGGGFPPGFTVKQAATSLLGYLTAYGVTLDPAQVDGPTLPLMTYDIKRVSAWFDEISVITGFVWEIDYNKVLRFIEPGTVPAPFNIADDDGNTVGDIIVEPTDVDYANRVIVMAGEGQREVTEDLVFNGVDDFVDLTYTMVGHRGYITVNAVNETLGGSPASWTHDPVLNRLTRETGPPAAGTGEIIYTAQFPYIAQADDAVAQAGPRGVVDAVITKTDVFEATLADALAEGYLLRMVAEPRRIRYTTHTPGLHPGQTQTIASSVRNINVTALITDVQARDIDGETMQYDVSAVEGDVYPGSWRDMYRDMVGAGGGSSSSAASGPITVVTSGGVGGSGTTGTLAQWMTPSTIGDATAVPSVLLTGTIAAARLPQFTGGDVVTSGAGSVVLAIQNGVIFDATVNAAAAIAWTKISKSGSSLADLTTRSAGDLTSGNLAYARMPSGSGTWSATPTISGVVTVQNDLDPALNYTSNLGATGLKYLSAHIAELWVSSLVAQSVVATIGGEVVVGPTTEVTVGIVAADTAIWVKHNQIASGDRLWLEANGQVEFMAATSGPTSGANGYQYSVTRNLDGSGANDWDAGTAVVNTGTTGDGFIHLYSTAGLFSGSGPTIVGNVRTGTTYNNIAPRWAIGDLNGLYDYGVSTFGMAAGDKDGAWIKVDATNGVRIGHGATTKLSLNASGTASFSEGAVTIDGDGIEVVPNNGVVFALPNAYKFTVADSQHFGMFGYDNATGVGFRTLGLLANSTTRQQVGANLSASSDASGSDRQATFAATVTSTSQYCELTAGVDPGAGFLFTFFRTEVGGVRWGATAGSGKLIASSTDVALLTNTGSDAADALKFILKSGQTTVVSGDILSTIQFESSDGSVGGTGIVAQIKAIASATYSGGTRSADLVFYTTAGTTTAEFMRLSGNGTLTLAAYTAATFVAGDKYLVVDAVGNVHRSALGPAS